MSATLVPFIQPLSVTAREMDARVKHALAKNREAVGRQITSACELSRESRKSSASSAKRMKAVRPDQPLPAGDVTERFEAIRANVR